VPSGTEHAGGDAPQAVSVVICAYTPERLEQIGSALASLRAQTVAPREIVLVIDHCPELESACRERWPEVRVVANREQQGLSGARNSGVAESTGEIVAFLDDDAVAAPNWVERLVAAYRDPQVAGAGGAVRPQWQDRRPPWFPPEFDWVVGCTHSGMPSEAGPVRNLVGANMSFRRSALLEAGGFRHQLGRVGKIPAGCEETDLCIRVAQRDPGRWIAYDPEATVDHFVPRERATPRYFASRCRGEGRSKAILSGLVGSEAGLSEERAYSRRTLPRGFLRGVGDALRGEPAGLARSGAIAAGLLLTVSGYLGGRPQAARLRRRREAPTDGDRLRVLVVTPFSPLRQGGVERHVMETTRRLAAAGDVVEVLCTEPGGPPLAEEQRDGVTIRTVRAWPASRDWCLAPGLWREMGRAAWDVIHIQSYHTLVAPLAMLRALTLRTPYVVTFHGGGHSSELRNRARPAQRLLMRPLLARAARLVAVARFEIEAYGRELRLPPERFALIPNGTDLAVAEASEPAAPDGRPTIASIGRLERYKGHHRVIAALPHVLEREPEARLMIVGTGPYEGELRSLVERLGLGDRVEFASTPPDQPEAMARLLAEISLVVLLSEFETHPLVALEAAAAGRRLLVADTSGLSEVAADGLARAIPLEESPAGVAAAVLEELRRPPPQATPQLASWDECSAGLQDLYRSLA
jgi:glycosyltransferase involved in cell wall biosynthesis